jgi:acyl carrier protein
MENSQTLNLLLKEVSKILNVDQVDADSGLGEIGIDSLNVVELIMVCEQIYVAEINPDQLSIDQYTTLRDLDRQLAAALPA